MKVEVDLKYLIEVVVKLTVEHYIDEYNTDDRFQPSKVIREIKGSCIESMENDLIDKLCDILKENE